MRGEVIALGTALPREHIINGRPVTTSIVREPMVGPLTFTLRGPVNNRPAVHTEHVLAFSAEHYDHWANWLGIDRATWPWVFWGENITLTGIDENRLMIGDRVRIGDVLFETTAPRTPCFKLSWRLGQPDEFLNVITKTGLVGHYLRVITAGDISVGDPVVVEPAGKTTISVGDIARLILDLQPEALPKAREAIAMPELGDLARMQLKQKVNHLEDISRCAPNRWTGWRRCRIVETTEQADGVRALRLAPIDGALAAYRAGQHIAVRLPGKQPITRLWSLSDYDDQPDTYRLTVKRGLGEGSRWIHQASVGDEVEIRAPSGSFLLDRANFFRVVLISAGVGVTPMVSMLKAHIERQADAPALVWLHSTQNRHTHIHRDEVDRLLATQPRFRRQVHFSAPDDCTPGVDHDRVGRITRDDIAAIWQTPYQSPDGTIEVPGEYTQFYICGSVAFTENIKGMLQSLEVPAGNIFSESFGGIGSPSRTGPSVEASEILFAKSGISARWDSDENLSLLELAQRAGINPPYSCRAGNCGACEATLVAGEIAYMPAPVHPPAAGACLPCCARPASIALTLDL